MRYGNHLVGIVAVGIVAVLVTACGSAARPSPAGNPHSQPNASQPNAYLATGSGWVNYLQQNSTGTLTEDTLSGTGRLSFMAGL